MDCKDYFRCRVSKCQRIKNMIWANMRSELIKEVNSLQADIDVPNATIRQECEINSHKLDSEAEKKTIEARDDQKPEKTEAQDDQKLENTDSQDEQKLINGEWTHFIQIKTKVSISNVQQLAFITSVRKCRLMWRWKWEKKREKIAKK